MVLNVEGNDGTYIIDINGCHTKTFQNDCNLDMSSNRKC